MKERSLKKLSLWENYPKNHLKPQGMEPMSLLF